MPTKIVTTISSNTIDMPARMWYTIYARTLATASANLTYYKCGFTIGIPFLVVTAKQQTTWKGTGTINVSLTGLFAAIVIKCI